MGDQLCSEESTVEPCLTLWGVEISWLRSSAEPTLVPWWMEQLDRLDNSVLPLFLREKVPVEVVITADLTNILLVGK